MQPAEPTSYRRDGVVVKASVSHLVDLGLISQVELYQKIKENGIHSFSCSVFSAKGIVWRTSRKTCLLCR